MGPIRASGGPVHGVTIIGGKLEVATNLSTKRGPTHLSRTLRTCGQFQLPLWLTIKRIAFVLSPV